MVYFFPEIALDGGQQKPVTGPLHFNLCITMIGATWGKTELWYIYIYLGVTQVHHLVITVIDPAFQKMSGIDV
ncbi:MAG: hypothetical protein DRR19_11675 [Candidatus Parabeggiatoa sp. nov. 1]|nr:MAG: hypothetical protein DRR19_11675 [Gammaproteobacteria bacterium]